MRIKVVLLLVVGMFWNQQLRAQEGEPIKVTAIQFDSETMEMFKGIDMDFLKMDEKGSIRVTKGHEILYFKKSGSVVFKSTKMEISAYFDKQKFPGGVTVHCDGCSNGCKAGSTNRGKITHYYCTPCGDAGKGQGCMGAVTVEKRKVLEYETEDGGLY